MKIKTIIVYYHYPNNGSMIVSEWMIGGSVKSHSRLFANDYQHAISLAASIHAVPEWLVALSIPFVSFARERDVDARFIRHAEDAIRAMVREAD